MRATCATRFLRNRICGMGTIPLTTATQAGFNVQCQLGIAGIINLGCASNRGVWDLPPVIRRFVIEKQLGANLPASFPVIDAAVVGAHGIASSVTSIKSLDIAASSYASGKQIESRVDGYIDSLAAFKSTTFNGRAVDIDDTTQKVLDLVVPNDVRLSPSQQAGLDAASAYAASKGITLNVITK